MIKNYSAFTIALSVSLGFIAVFILLSATGTIQSATTYYLIGEASRWCETVSGGLFREPLNTLSNLGFMVSGLYIFWILSNDPEGSKNTFIGINPISVTFASVVIFLGPGSMLMHGTNTEWGGWADNLSMIMFIIFPWLYNCFLMTKWTRANFFKTYISIILIYAVWRWFTDWGLGINLNLFSVSIGLWVISEALYKFWSPRFRFYSGFVGFLVLQLFGISIIEVFNNMADYWWIIFFWLPGLLSNSKPTEERSYKWYFLGCITYFSAFAIWSTGVPEHEYCAPDSIIQAHSIWHLLSALATFFFFLHYRNAKA